MYINVNEMEKVPLDSPRGQEALKEHLAKQKAKQEAEALESEARENEAKALALAEAEAILRQAADEAGVSVLDLLNDSVKKSKAK